jgi:prostaglandin-endoperoxide synthase 2
MRTAALIRAARALGLGGIANRWAIDHFASATHPRPRPFSLWSHTPQGDTAHPEYVSDYTSWPGLTDRVFSARHLPPAPASYVAGLPPDAPFDFDAGVMGDVTALFARTGAMLPSRSSALFAFFAQWFTDSVLRFHPDDRRRNTSNHDIDLCQIYGLRKEATDALRSGQGGRLKSQIVGDEELPEYLGALDAGGHWHVKPEYHSIVDDSTVDDFLQGFVDKEERKKKLYASGLERGNSSIGYVAISTIFLREHNRLCAELARRNPAWNDERLFQTARMINVVLLKLVVEDYINHILGAKLFELDTSFAESKRWYRPNWIAAEFDLLYRWHSLMPDKLTVGGKDHDHLAFRNNGALLEGAGVAATLDAASREPAGRIALLNTPRFLWGAEAKAIEMGRSFRLRPYNDYRERFGLRRLGSFGELTRDEALRRRLEALYSEGVDQLEFVVGIFAEESDEPSLFGGLLTHMVAYDAFTQIFTNPLLAQEIYGARTFTEYGLEVIEETDSIETLAKRNLAPGSDARAKLGLPGS